MQSRLIGLVLAVVFFAACEHDPNPIKGAGEVAGRYFHPIKSGELEVVVLHPDMSYEHYLYDGERAYQNGGKPLYSNMGTWRYEGREISFDSWDLFYSLGDPGRVLTAPFQKWEFSGSWGRPSRSGHKEAMIWVSDEPMYVFERRE